MNEGVQLQKPGLTEVMKEEDIQLKPRGKYLWACCPLHSERTPSFKVDPERQTFYCFGCGIGGDVISFIQKYKNLSFKEALSYLGISTGKPTPEAIKKIQQQKHKRELIKGFRAWCYEKHDSLCTLYSELQEIKNMVRKEEDLESLARFYQLESLWLYQIEVLQGNDDESKFELYREVVYGD